MINLLIILYVFSPIALHCIFMGFYLENVFRYNLKLTYIICGSYPLVHPLFIYFGFHI